MTTDEQDGGPLPRLGELRVRTGGSTPARARSEVRRVGAWDGLPMVDPTADRVTAMLGGRRPLHRVPPLPPLALPALVEDVAVCAVLAGCTPPGLPYLLAALAGAAAPDFNLLGISTTTGNAAVGLVVHGPGSAVLGAGCGPNCLGPGPVNAALGRALALCCRLLGGALPGTLDMATVGQPAKLGLCAAEATPPEGWQPLHAARGLPADADAVTVFAAAGIVEIADIESDTAGGLLETMAAAVVLPAAVGATGDVLGGGEQLLILPPEWASRLAAQGWSRRSVVAFLYDHAVIPVDRLPASGRARVSEAVARAGVVRSARSPDHFLLLVAGGVGMKAAYLPSWPGGSTAQTRAVR